MSDAGSFDMRVQLASIDRSLAESAKLRAETEKLIAEQRKLTAEQMKFGAEERKLHRDRFLAPFLAAAATMAAFAGVGAGLLAWVQALLAAKPHG